MEPKENRIRGHRKEETEVDDLEDLIDFGNVDWDKYETNIEPKDSDDQVFKLHLLFKGDDIPLVKDTLGDNPEQKILELIKNDRK